MIFRNRTKIEWESFLKGMQIPHQRKRKMMVLVPACGISTELTTNENVPFEVLGEPVGAVVAIKNQKYIVTCRKSTTHDRTYSAL